MLAVTRQKDECLAVIDRLGWHLQHEYSDNSVSASKKNVHRPAYEQMRADYVAGKIDAIVCWDQDRLTRQPAQLEWWIAQAEEHGLLIATVDGAQDMRSPNGIMVARIRAAAARAEVDHKGGRQRAAIKQKIASGKLMGGVRATGYDADWSIIPDQAAVVRDVFDRFVTGTSIYQLTKDLNAAGTPTRRGGPWTISTVRSILTNATYAGLAKLGAKVIEVKEITWEPIIDRPTYDLAQATLADPARKKNHGNNERKHLGAGLYRCWKCERKVVTNGTRYSCRPGGHVLRSQAQVDAFVLVAISERLSRPDAFPTTSPRANPRVKELSIQARKLQNRIDAITADYAAGDLTAAEMREAKDIVQAQLHAVETEQINLSAGSAIASVTDSTTSEKFLNANLSQKRAIIDSIATVTLMPGKRGSRIFDPATINIRWKG